MSDKCPECGGDILPDGDCEDCTYIKPKKGR